MAYQEVTHTSYGTRVGNSIKGIGTGFILFFAGTALLWWNEGRAVKTDKMLNEAEGVTVEMAEVAKVDPTFEGKLVHATALANTEDSLTDNTFGIGAKAISISRKVEYFQYVEHAESKSRDKLGGGQETVTTYTYTTEWTSNPVNSGQFHDPNYQQKNYVLRTVEAARQYASNVTFGAYKLNTSQIQSISKEEPMEATFSEEQIDNWNKETRSTLANRRGTTMGDSATCVHASGNILYFGTNTSSPQVGDVRVTFTKVMPTEISILATVTGDTFAPFKAKNGKTLSVVSMGNKSAAEMYEAEHTANSVLLWILRLVGIMTVIGGLKGIFGILETLMKVIPFLSSIVGFGVGLVCTIVGAAWSLVVIALAWLFYRPLIGILLLALAGGLIWVFAFKGKEKLKAMAQKKGQPQPQEA